MTDDVTTDSTDSTAQPRRHAAGLFDVRNIIGALLAIYGVILLLVAIFGGTTRSAAGNDGANLWMGVALLVAGAFFLVWARVRPIVVDEVALRKELAGDDDDGSTLDA